MKQKVDFAERYHGKDAHSPGIKSSARAALTESLTKKLLELDTVQSRGLEKIRAQRKILVLEIQGHLTRVEKIPIIKDESPPASQQIMASRVEQKICENEDRENCLQPEGTLYETETEVVAVVTAPNMKLADFGIEVERDVLVVSGDCHSLTAKGVRFEQRSSNSGPFKVRFQVPSTADPDSGSATYNAPYLRIKFKKIKTRHRRLPQKKPLTSTYCYPSQLSARRSSVTRSALSHRNVPSHSTSRSLYRSSSSNAQSHSTSRRLHPSSTPNISAWTGSYNPPRRLSAVPNLRNTAGSYYTRSTPSSSRYQSTLPSSTLPSRYSSSRAARPYSRSRYL